MKKSKSIALVLAAAVCAAACQDKPAPPARSAATGPAVPPAAIGAPRDRLEKLRNDTVIEQSKFLSTASNIANYRSTLRKYEREAAAVRLFERVPEAPQIPELRTAVEKAVKPLGVAIAG